MRTQDSMAVQLANPFRLIDAFFADSLPEVFPDTFAPPTSIAETPDAFVLTFDLPGVDESQIQLDVHDRELTISAERPDPRAGAPEATTWHRSEPRFGRLSRQILLPESANPQAVEATSRRGVLEVRVQKHPASKPVRVAIKAS